MELRSLIIMITWPHLYSRHEWWTGMNHTSNAHTNLVLSSLSRLLVASVFALAITVAVATDTPHILIEHDLYLCVPNAMIMCAFVELWICTPTVNFTPIIDRHRVRWRWLGLSMMMVGSCIHSRRQLLSAYFRESQLLFAMSMSEQHATNENRLRSVNNRPTENKGQQHSQYWRADMRNSRHLGRKYNSDGLCS